MSKVLRTVKNVVKNYTIPEVKTREATSNDPWFASTVELDELAHHTFHPKSQHEIYQILYKRLNDHPKYWRHVLKSLIVFEYLTFHGHDDMYRLLTTTSAVMNSLTTFMFVDKDGKDKGNFIRERAKRMVKFIEDPKYFKSEKQKAVNTKKRVNKSDYSNSPTHPFETAIEPTRNTNPNRPDYAPKTREEEDMQLQLALAISKQEAQEMQTLSLRSASNDSDSDKYDAFSSQHNIHRSTTSTKSPSKSSAPVKNEPQPSPQLIDVFSNAFDNTNTPQTSNNYDLKTGSLQNNDFYNVFAAGNASPFMDNNVPSTSYTNPLSNIPFSQNNYTNMQPSSTAAQQQNTYNRLSSNSDVFKNDDFDTFIKSPSPFESVASNLNVSQQPSYVSPSVNNVNNQSFNQSVNNPPKSEAFKFVHESGLVDLNFDVFKGNNHDRSLDKKKFTLNEMANKNSSMIPDSSHFPPANPTYSGYSTYNNVGFNSVQPSFQHNPFESGSPTPTYSQSNYPQNYSSANTNSNNSYLFNDNPFDDKHKRTNM